MVGNFFKQLRKERHLTQKDVADELGTTYVTIGNWERGSTFPDMPMAKKVAAFYGVTVDELSKGRRQEPLREVEYIPSDRSGRFIRVPVIGRIPAGIPIEAIEEIEDWEDLPVASTVMGKRYFGLKIKGDSMEPEYRDGDVIIIQQQEDCQSGDDCAVMVNGNDATFKRVRISENGITLQPLNSKYEPHFFTAEQVRALPVRILGVVIEIRRRIKRP